MTNVKRVTATQVQVAYILLKYGPRTIPEIQDILGNARNATYAVRVAIDEMIEQKFISEDGVREIPGKGMPARIFVIENDGFINLLDYMIGDYK